jgi:endonuclease/exonuclease/phosphatase family metal-dependent hydrolase
MPFTAGPRRQVLRFVTYNIYFGGADRVDALERVLRRIAPDAAALTEADDPQVVAELARRLDLRHVWAKGSGDRHIALLTRFPIREWKIYNRPPLTQAALETALDLGQRGSLTVYSVHLLPYLLLPFEVRRAQATRALLKHAAAAPGPCLILGDLNAIAPGDRVLQSKNPWRMRRLMLLQANIIFHFAIPELLRAGYVDCYRACHPAAGRANHLPSAARTTADGFTWHTGNRTTRYDYIFADARMAPRLRDCRVVDDIPGLDAASDHYPLLAEFDLDQ